MRSQAWYFAASSCLDAHGITARVCICSRADSNAVLLQPRQPGPAAEEGAGPGDSGPAQKLSKAQKRKRQKVQEEKAKRTERAQVQTGCCRHAVSGDSMALNPLSDTTRRCWPRWESMSCPPRTWRC